MTHYICILWGYDYLYVFRKCIWINKLKLNQYSQQPYKVSYSIIPFYR